MVNFVDILLPVIVVIAAYFGRYRGTIRQFGAVTGVIIGIFIAAYIYSLLAFLTESSIIRAVILGLLLIAITFLSYDLFAALGKYIQKKSFLKKFAKSVYDKIGSAAMSGLLAFVIFWLGALVVGPGLPSIARTFLKESQVLSLATKYAQPPTLITNVGQLLQSFSSPDVFASKEPVFDANALPVPERYGELDKSITKAKAALAKVTTWGCGSVGTGSGFMIGKNLILTNAHVIAGADRISVENNQVTHIAKPVWFDSQLDIAILLTNSELPGAPLSTTTSELMPGAIGAILGFPGGKDLVAHDVVILQTTQAEGYDIYKTNKVKRQIYVVRSSIAPGDSGGPLIDISGRVAGVIVGHSDVDERVGFIISVPQINSAIQKAHSLKDIVNTGPCAGV